MDYIINPAWFYWIEVVNGLKGVAIGTLAVSIVCAILFCAFYFGAKSMIRQFPSCCSEEKARLPIYKKGFTISCIVLPIAICAVVFIPSKTVLIEMMVARVATYDNVALTVDGIKSVVDYIVNAFQTIGG